MIPRNFASPAWVSLQLSRQIISLFSLEPSNTIITKIEKPVLLARPTELFHLGRFFYSLLKLCKTSHFWSKSKKLWLNFFGELKTFFQNFSLKTLRLLGNFIVVEGSHFGLQKGKKENKKSPPTNPSWKVRPPEKQGFFFTWPYGAFSMMAIVYCCTEFKLRHLMNQIFIWVADFCYFLNTFSHDTYHWVML